MAVSRSSSSKKDQEKDVGCAKTVLRVLYAICIAPIVWFATRTVVGESSVHNQYMPIGAVVLLDVRIPAMREAAATAAS